MLGLLTLHRIQRVLSEEWAIIRVEQVILSRDELKTVRPDAELGVVFERMASKDVNQFPVMENGQLLDMVARDNVLAFLRARAELEV